MLIQNLIYRKSQNMLQDAGDLDGQILSDLEGLRQKLRDYQTEHLDQKVKGRSNHYGAWTAENQKKLQWLDRALELLRAGMLPQAAPPDRLTKEAWDALGPRFREPTVLAIARREAAHIRKYLPETVYVERQSLHPADWYLWSVAACREDGRREWDCWTLNLTTGSMNGGRYGLSLNGLKTALASKKGVSPCDPSACSAIQNKEE